MTFVNLNNSLTLIIYEFILKENTTISQEKEHMLTFSYQFQFEKK